jgi:sec-independent protein translocase protein TatC
MMKRTFLEHLKIVKKFFIYFLYSFVIFFFITYILLYKYINIFFLDLLKNIKIDIINYTSIYDGFFIPIKLSFYFTTLIFIIIFLTSFLIFIDLNRIALYFLISLPIILYINFKYLIPITWKSFFSIAPIMGKYFITVNEIFDFALNISICTMSVFYMPTILVILYKYKIIPPKIFTSIKKYWILISIFISGILAPADIISHLVMSLSMIIYFYILIFFLN